MSTPVLVKWCWEHLSPARKSRGAWWVPQNEAFSAMCEAWSPHDEDSISCKITFAVISEVRETR